MLTVKCINNEQSNTLQLDKTYYAFEANKNSYYISNFPKQNAHFGAFQKDRFIVVDPAADKTELLKVYIRVADVLYVGYGFKTLNNFIAIYAHQNLKQLIGTTTESEMERYEVIGKVNKVYVLQTPITREKMQQAEQYKEEALQLSLF